MQSLAAGAAHRQQQQQRDHLPGFHHRSDAPAVVRVHRRSRRIRPRAPWEGGLPVGGRALRRPAAVGGQMGDVRPQHREERPGLGLLRRPEAEAASPAAEPEARTLPEVSPPLSTVIIILFL